MVYLTGCVLDMLQKILEIIQFLDELPDLLYHTQNTLDISCLTLPVETPQ